MLPERLSTDLTSLSEGEDRAAVVIEFVVGARRLHRPAQRLSGDGAQSRAARRIARWGRGSKARATLAGAAPDIQQQLRLQDEAAHALRQARDRMGALTFDRKEVEPVVENGQVQDIATRASNRGGAPDRRLHDRRQ